MSLTKHPKGLYLLFFTEMWERFSYYGMRGILVLFLTKAMLMNNAEASNIYGNFTGLVYLTPLIGGYIADRYWGNKRSIVLGGILMAIGQFLMFCSASMLSQLEMSRLLLPVALAFLIIGNGFFKPNISSMVGDLYEQGDKRKDSAYTIFYMGINLGAFVSPLICGSLAETEDVNDFRWGFLVACVGMIFGVVTFLFKSRSLLVSPNGQEIGGKPQRTETSTQKSKFDVLSVLKFVAIGSLLVCAFFYFLDVDLIGSFIFAFSILVPCYVLFDSSLTKDERYNIGVIIVLSFFAIFFFAAFEQAGASLTFFTDEHVDRTLFGHEIKTSHFQSLNALFVILFAPVMSSLWMYLESKNIEVSSTTKQAIGMALLSVSYFFIAFGVHNVGVAEKVSMMWIVTLYWIHTIGELSLSPIGLSMVNKLSPARFASIMMSVWLLSSSAAAKLSGTLSELYPAEGEVKSLLGYSICNLHDFFMVFAVMVGIAAVALSVVAYFINKRIKI